MLGEWELELPVGWCLQTLLVGTPCRLVPTKSALGVETPCRLVPTKSRLRVGALCRLVPTKLQIGDSSRLVLTFIVKVYLIHKVHCLYRGFVSQGFPRKILVSACSYCGILA